MWVEAGVAAISLDSRPAALGLPYESEIHRCRDYCASVLTARLGLCQFFL
jgi:hypothetical protein